MEELLLVIVSALLEIVAEILAFAPWDLLLWVVERRRGSGGGFERPAVVASVLGVLLGAVTGIFSLQIFPRTMLHHPWLRVANRAVAPFASAWLARAVASRRASRGTAVSPRLHVAFSFALTLGLVLVRFVHAVRPE